VGARLGKVKPALMTKQHHMSFESAYVADQPGLFGSTLLCDPKKNVLQSGTLKILLLAQDLCDAAIWRRVAMLCAGGAKVTVAGFRRTPQPVLKVGGCRTVDFGQTFNGNFCQRIGAVFPKVMSLRRYKTLFTDADLIIARNLDMLAIGARGRSLCAKPLPVLIYECLDIHRILLGSGPVGMVLRWLERQLSRQAAGILTSSPAFVSHYFQTIAHLKTPIRLVENKVLDIKNQMTPRQMPPAPKPGPPWKIGYFGKIRCSRSLRLLIELAQQSRGKLEVIIRGKLGEHLLGEFDQRIRDLPGIRFLGPYKNPQDLEDIYRNVHFSWAIDLLDEGLNSSWLLPNRIYEGGLYGAVPIALSSVQTGRYLESLGVGAILDDPLGPELRDFFATLTPEKYCGLKDAILSLPRATWVTSRSECEGLVKWLGGLHGSPKRHPSPKSKKPCGSSSSFSH
jgi:hypothetical protein